MLRRRLAIISHNSAAAAAARLLPAANSSSTTNTADRKKPAISQRVRFIDRLRVTAKGGHGGGGSGALFGRTGHHPRAAGGNGAAGGSVILRATRQLTGLGSIPLVAQAARGGNGGKQWMDGAKGADTVVQVPLGTLVWRLLQLSGGPDRPHGITAAASPGSSSSWSSPPAVAAAAAAAAVEGAAISTHGSSSGGGGSRRRSLFPSAAQAEAAPAAAAAATAGLAPAPGSEAPAAAGDVGSHSSHRRGSTFDQGDELVDELYLELVSCRRLLSNAQKLHLLHTGRLASAAQLGQQQSAAAAAAVLDDGADTAVSEKEESDYEGSGDDVQAPGGLWQQQQQHDGFEDDDDVAAHRQFSKAQVWSILEAQGELLGELDQPGQQLLVARGGRGGRGNAASTRRQAAPASRQRSEGLPGEEVLLLMRLRLLADVVLVGLPNVGKSSLIAALTGARAQVGSYAFTTLRPQLGVVTTDWGSSQPSADQQQQQQQQQEEGVPPRPGATGAVPPTGPAAAAVAAGAAASSSDSDGGRSSQQLVIADLPGLVPGAHAGRGRGTAFLAHLERAACLALVLDMTGVPQQQQQQQQQQPSEGQAGAALGASEPPSAAAAAALEAGEVLVPYSPVQQLAILQEELAAHDARVLQLPMVVVANKIDRLTPEAAAADIQRLKEATQLPIVLVSAKQAMGLQRLKHALQLLVPPR